MSVSWQKTIIAFVGSVLLAASHASATTLTFLLDQSGTGPVGVAGTITLDDTLSGPDAVNVLVTLNPGYGFVKTGAGDALEFNVAGSPVITNFTSGFGIGPAPDTAPPFGGFLFSVSCTTGCGNGGSNPNPGPLSFDVFLSGITVDSFVGNNPAHPAVNYYFAADVIGPGPEGVPITGNVAALDLSTTPSTPSPVPEPASLLLFGSGLAFAARKLRRKAA